MTQLVIDLDKLNFRELFEVCHQRIRNRIKRPIRLTIPGQINMHASIRKNKPAVACKAIEYESKSLVPLHIAWTFEELV